MSFIGGPSQAVADRDGFAPPTFGGAVAVKFGQVTHADTTARRLFTLPAGAEIVGWLLNVSTPFNAGSGNLLDVGDGVTANRFADNLALGTAGQIVTGYDDDELFTQFTEEVPVYATYVPSGTTPTAGVATLAVFYMVG